MLRNTRQALLCAVLSVCAILAWQSATIGANRGGNWTALFCTGALRGVPSTLSGEHIYEFPGSEGYDGQMYHYIAHDPLMRDKVLTAFLDEPRLRYRRILVPGLAWIASLGHERWVDRAYFAVCLFFAGLGVFWACLLCRSLGYSAAWGAAFVLLPAALVSMDRVVTDVALAALSVGFLLYSERPSPKLFAILTAAALVRETGFFLIAGYCGWLLLNRRWSASALYSLAAAPALAWYAYVHLRTANFLYVSRYVPLAEFVGAIAHPMPFPPGMPYAPIVRAIHLMSQAGVLLAFVLAFVLVARRNVGPEYLAGLCFALTGVFLQRSDHWLHVYDFGRIYTPLLIFLVIHALRTRRTAWALPWVMMLPRIGVELAPQLLGVARAAIHRG